MISIDIQQVRAYTYWDTWPGSDECGQQLSSSNVDVFRAERNQIVCGTDGVGRNIDTKRHNQQTNGAEC
jgi:hypothetical protein